VTVEQFWSRVEKGNDCWLWRGCKQSGGYGSVNLNGTKTYAHRVSYELLVGAIPEGLQIDHLCRVRLCVNPEHLEAVTPRVNILRGVGFSANHARKTHCPKGHPYAGDNVYMDGSGRRCRTCRKAHYRRVYLRRKAAA
jgi:hypothetical protein